METFLHQVQLGLCVHKTNVVVAPCDTTRGVCTACPLETNHHGANHTKAHNGVFGKSSKEGKTGEMLHYCERN